MPAVTYDIKAIWPALRNETLSTPFPRASIDIQLLVGITTFMKVTKEPNTSYGTITYNEATGLCSLTSRHGLIIFGEILSPLTHNVTNCACIDNNDCIEATTTETNENLNNNNLTYAQGNRLDILLDKYFKLESYGIYNGENFENNTILDNHALNEFKEHHFVKDNQFYVPVIRLPKQIYPVITSNLSHCLNRHKSLQARLRKNPKLADAFNNKVKSLVDQGVVTNHGPLRDNWHKFDKPQEPFNEYVLAPIRLVLKEGKSTSCRLTLDAKHTNAILCPGKMMLNNVFNIFLKYRLSPYTATLDISQMFFCLKYATEADKNLWYFLYKNINDDKPISVLRFENPVMGSKSSQFLAINSLHKINERHPEKPHLKDAIDHAYSDNLNVLADSPEECNKHLLDCINTLEKYNFKCHEIISDNATILRNVPRHKLSKDFKHTMFSETILESHDNKDDVQNTNSSCLGMKYYIDNEKQETFLTYDHFANMVHTSPTVLTKRTISSTLSSMYCVLQLVAPILSFGKIVLNLVWQLDREVQTSLLRKDETLSKTKAKKLGITWDTNLLTLQFDDDNINKKLQEILMLWERFILETQKLKGFTIPRYVFKRFDGVPIAKKQLITLSDAGKYLIACMVYLRLLLKDGGIRTALLCCKSRVRNKLTIARAELVGVLDAVSLGNKVQDILNISPDNTFHYTDNSVSIFQIQRANSKGYTSLNIFVGNTCQKILEKIHNVSHIKFIPGKDDQLNKSDLITKGGGVENLDQDWFFAPKAFRDKDIPEFNHLLQDLDHNESNLEAKDQTISLAALGITYENDVISKILTLTHSPNKTSRIVANILHFIVNIKKRIHNRNGNTTRSVPGIFEYIQDIAQYWCPGEHGTSSILNTNTNDNVAIPISFKKRKRVYPFITKDFNVLLQPTTSLDYFIAATVVIHFDQIMHFKDDFRKIVDRENIPDKYAVLRPFVEEKTQIIRILGRVQDSNMPSGKFQILLHYQSKLGRKLIYHLHVRFYCTGLRFIIHHVRQEFWIPKMRKATDSVIKKCILCQCRNLKNDITKKEILNGPPLTSLQNYRCRLNRKPFEFVFLDLKGPCVTKTSITINKDGSKKKKKKEDEEIIVYEQKLYILNITCSQTRAVNLEVMDGRTTEQLLSALKRFFARRGLCKHIVSDGALELQRGAKEIHHLWDVFDKKKVMEFCTDNRITWRINIPHSPFLQSLVEVLQKPLKKALQTRFAITPNFTEFITMISLCEAYMNARPIGVVSSSSTDPSETISPIQLLQGSQNDFLPSYSYNKGFKIPNLPTTKSLVVRRAMIEQQTSRFWGIWESSYIEELNKIPSNTKKQFIPKIGDTVLMDGKDLGFRKGHFALGLITDIHSRQINPIKRDEIRSVTVKYMKNNGPHFVTKSIFKIAPLELTYLQDIYENNDDKCET